MPARISHLLNGSVSWARRNARSALVDWRVRITGAENSRRIDGIGSEARPSKEKPLLAFRHFQHGGRNDLVAVWRQKPDGDWDDLRQFRFLSRCRLRFLLEIKRVRAVFEVTLNRKPGRPRLGIPAFELAEVAAGRILKHLQPVFKSSQRPRHAVQNRGRAPWSRHRPPPVFSAFG